MNNEPLEVLPYGRDAAAQERLDAKKRAGRRGGFGCLTMALIVLAWIIYQAGFMAGLHS